MKTTKGSAEPFVLFDGRLGRDKNVTRIVAASIAFRRIRALRSHQRPSGLTAGNDKRRTAAAIAAFLRP